ncbi:MAG: 2-amino-4-hydroxy-6-hydroxymethyldihydropteridine diphosphokinase [Candidatus Methylomirabilales bacterium]
MRAFLGLGSNLGDRMANLRRALRALSALGEVVAVSSVYETDPVGGPLQPDFLNAACEVETALPALDLVSSLKSIELDLGRRPGVRWGPRPIDLDLLLYGPETFEEPELVVPHAELTKRAFVLVPLLEIAPDLELPSGEPLSAFLEADPLGVRRVAPPVPRDEGA